MLEKYKKICEKNGIKYSTDLSICILIVSILLVLSIILTLLFSISIGIVCIVFALSYIYLHCVTLNNSYLEIVNSKEIAFEKFYKYLMKLLNDGVEFVNSLEKSLDFCDNTLHDDINKLILEINEGNVKEAFISFSENFENDDIKYLIILMNSYKEDENNKKLLGLLNKGILSLTDESKEKYIETKCQELNKYKYAPVILTVLTIIIVSIFVFSIMSEEING